jgi:hypothetical protein
VAPAGGHPVAAGKCGGSGDASTPQHVDDAADPLRVVATGPDAAVNGQLCERVPERVERLGRGVEHRRVGDRDERVIRSLGERLGLRAGDGGHCDEGDRAFVELAAEGSVPVEALDADEKDAPDGLVSDLVHQRVN